MNFEGFVSQFKRSTVTKYFLKVKKGGKKGKLPF